ncbi:Probable transmembrane protein [plant metagenome]|uniref:Probable transmembrane protein n=1 Tax=plant metagenome TaxID=1297885 RepID=A0A484U721_9ZZZZ
MSKVLVRVLAALWVGALWCVGILVAPTLFATLSPAEAGMMVGKLFFALASFGLVAAVLMLLLDRLGGGELLGRAGRLAAMLMAVGVGVGYFGLKPLMDHGRVLLAAGITPPPWADFGLLHGVSSLIYFLVALLGLRLVAVLR